MTNLDTVIETLAAHREARRWSDDAVAADVLARLGLDPAGIAHVTEAEVLAAEAEAQAAADKAASVRAALDARVVAGSESHQTDEWAADEARTAAYRAQLNDALHVPEDHAAEGHDDHSHDETHTHE